MPDRVRGVRPIKVIEDELSMIPGYATEITGAVIEAHAHAHMMMVSQKYGLGWWSDHASGRTWVRDRLRTTKLR